MIVATAEFAVFPAQRAAGKAQARRRRGWLTQQNPLERGAPIHVVKQTLGHESLETTGQNVDASLGEWSGKYVKINISQD